MVTYPQDLQNYNRYAYCLNNPVTCTDPTGFDAIPQVLPIDGTRVIDVTQTVAVTGSRIPVPVGPRILVTISYGAGPVVPGGNSNEALCISCLRAEANRILAKALEDALKDAVEAAKRLGEEALKQQCLANPNACLLAIKLGFVTAAQIFGDGGSGSGPPSPASDTYGSPPGGPDGEDDETGSKVRFHANDNQKHHTFRHLKDHGLDADVVRDAIKQDLQRLGDSLKDGLNKLSVNVNGVRLDYHAYRFSDGSINVGRITPPKGPTP